MRIAAGAEAGLPRLDGVPQFLTEDPQLPHFLDYTFGFRIHPCLALAGIGILDGALLVPRQLAHVHLVVKDAGAARPVAVDRREAPAHHCRSRDAFVVEMEGDGARAQTRSEVAEDTTDHLGFHWIDGSVALDRLAAGVKLAQHIITAGVAATGPAHKLVISQAAL